MCKIREVIQNNCNGIGGTTMYKFPENLYADVRIEENYSIWLNIQNGEVMSDNDISDKGAMIRVFDGNMWYSCSTNNLDNIQTELDNLAALATPNPDILSNPIVEKFEVNKDKVLLYEGENDVRKIPRQSFKELIDNYVEKCVDDAAPEIKKWNAGTSAEHTKVSFYSSKGSELVWDKQCVELNMFFEIAVDGAVTGAWKGYKELDFAKLWGHEDEINAEKLRYLEFAKNAVAVEPGDYICIFSPNATSLFTHESFGHKSESDYMLNDKTLQDEWVIGKKVGNEKISISDRGDILNSGYIPYDYEGTKARENWLIKEGVLSGRLHNAKSASILGEELTGNSRAGNYDCQPIVRMTNTYMSAGTDDPEEMIKGVKDGIYVYDIDRGTGNSDFSIIPRICYRIHDGKICEPVRVNIIMGNVFQTLFDVDAVGTDFMEFQSFWCGKNGQTISVGVGGPSIRIKKLKIS